MPYVELNQDSREAQRKRLHVPRGQDNNNATFPDDGAYLSYGSIYMVYVELGDQGSREAQRRMASWASRSRQ